jgi:putative transposase
MDLRRCFIEDCQLGVWPLAVLCREYGISRTTAYKWLERVAVSGWAGLAERSRRPHHSPLAVPAPVCAAVCEAHAHRPAWGPRKLRQWLMRRVPQTRWPSRVTIAAIWRRAGGPPPVPPPPRAARGPRARTEATGPNVVWTVDFKGDFRLGDGSRCYPLTLRDQASRYTLACRGLTAPEGRLTQRWMDRAFAEYGLPTCIRSDNGEPFAGLGLAGLSRLNIGWLRLGIRVEQIEPGRPDQNGSHEQFHRVLKAHTARPPAANLRAQQHRFETFRCDYNAERPHDALNGESPAHRYQPSPRPWPPRLPPVEYPGHWEPCVVQPNGRIAWHQDSIFLSRALAGERVALEEIDDGIWTVHFASLPLARWRARDRQLRPIGWD